ncbi:MAG: hypothetical protein DMF56_11335 [Acidobacteria bacterium]|nr:MAG: hypothetical protein DMF56_11335 [Acidobacteriota bacterium]
MEELAAALRACRAAIRDGRTALYAHLVNLNESWADTRYKEFRARLEIELDVIRYANEDDLEQLEHRLYILRERLLRYHEESIARGSASIFGPSAAAIPIARKPTPREIELQRAEYESAYQSGRLRIGERLVKRPIQVAAISPPQNASDFKWEHHGNDKATYIELASTFAELTPLVQQGHHLDELKQQNDRYRAAIDAFWSRNEPIKVDRFRDIYVVEAGRHRVAAVLEIRRSDLLEALVTTMNSL